MNNWTVFSVLASTVILGSHAQAAYPSLPEPVSNNAVAKVSTAQGSYLLSFMGLNNAKDYTGVHNKVWSLKLNDEQATWQSAKSVPYVAPLAGRLAAVAVGVADMAYVFGGFTVAKNHQEISTVDNYRFDVLSNTYQRIADMPVAVDDTAISVYQNRYLYLFGGWHNDGNVNLVQVYDTQTNTWQQASPMPAPAVFGQAVAMVDNQLVFCDGVKVKANLHKRRSYQASPVCLYGKINPNNHLRISWQAIEHFSETNQKSVTALYRMAATGVANTKQGQATFVGGSDNPYNYEGIGYNGQPSEPSQWQYSFDFASQSWLPAVKLETPSMDHRGLICHDNTLLRVGGMLASQQVSDAVLSQSLAADEMCTP
ncbi:Kelch repeat-containing protein [Shewanella maritima]|uniref:Kelch repeat-containing protein n=1 Tax=Shewanella maritima TaxID=2520507 RepID=UPI003735B333